MTTFRAVWNGTVLAQSSHTVRLAGNHYLPVASLRREYFTDNPTTTTCSRKGLAPCYHIRGNGKTNRDAGLASPCSLTCYLTSARAGATGRCGRWSG